MRECTNVLKKEEKPLNASSILYKLWFAAGKETFSENKITYICDFSRSGLNTRLYTLVSKLCSETTNIGYFILWELSLAAHANSEFILRKIWGRLQTVVTFWGIEILEDWHLSYHFKLFDIITIFGRFPGFIHSPYNFFAFFSIFTANWGVQIVGMVFQTRSS